MPDCWARAIPFTAPTSTGNSDITITGPHSGDTPKAVKFIMCGAIADNTDTLTARYGWGIADATNNGALASLSEDDTTNTNDDRWGSFGAHGSAAGHCIGLFSDTSPNMDFKARFVSFAAGKCTINTLDAATSAYKGVAIFYGGTDLNAAVLKADIPASGTFTYTPGFPTTIAYFGSVDKGKDDAVSAFGYLNQGVMAYNDPTITQANHAGIWRDSQGNGWTAGAVHNAESYVDIGSSGIAFTASVTSVTSTTVVQTIASGTGDTSDDQIGLFLGGTGATYANLRNYSGSTGNVAYTGWGFEPEIAEFMLSRQTAEATWANNGNQPMGSSAWGFVDYGTDGTDGVEGCVQIYSEDGAGTTNTNSRYDTKVWKLFDDAMGAANDWEATHVSLDADGYTINQAIAGSASAFFMESGFEKGTGAAAGNPGKTNPLFGRSPLRGPIS